MGLWGRPLTSEGRALCEIPVLWSTVDALALLYLPSFSFTFSLQCTGKPLILGISARTHGFTARLHDYAISTPAPAGACPWPCAGCTSISSFDAEGSCNSLELAVTSRVPSPPRRLRHITAVTAPATATTEASIPLSAATRSSEDFGSATVANLTGGGGGGGGAKATPMP